MLGIGGTLKEKPDDTELQRVMVGDVELKEMRRERGHFTGYKEKGAETVVVNMRMAKKGYTLEVHFLGGGEWIQNLKGDELKKTLEERGFKGDELGKVLHEGNLRGAALDKTLKGADTIRVVEGKEGGADIQVLKWGKIVQTLRGAMVKNHVHISEGWTGIPVGTAGTSEEFQKYWDSARIAMSDYRRREEKNLPDMLTTFLGQGHTL